MTAHLDVFMCPLSRPIKETESLGVSVRLEEPYTQVVQRTPPFHSFVSPSQFAGCPKSWKILGTMQFASVVLAASGLLASINAAPQLFGPSPSAPFTTSAVSAPR